MTLEIVLRLLQELEKRGVDYVVVEAVALAFHGLPRATADVDLFVRPEPENIARLRDALRAIWDDPEIDAITADDLAGEYPTVRYGPPGEDFVIDILSRLGTAFSFENIEAEDQVTEGTRTRVRVATPRMLYRMKCDTIRPQDRADAAALRDRFRLTGD